MCGLRAFFVLMLETPTLRRSRNRPFFVKIRRPVPLAPILVAHVVGLGKGVTYLAGERAANGSLCVEQRCTQ